MAPTHTGLRPIERVILRLQDEGLGIPDIARKLNKKPGTIERILGMIDYRDGSRPPSPPTEGLRPVERVVLRYRDRGENYGEIGSRIGRSGAHVRRIEQYARIKLGWQS